MERPISRTLNTIAWHGIAKGILRILICIVAVFAVTAVLYAVPLRHRDLTSALTFLIVVLTVSAAWGFRFALFVSLLTALGFSWLVTPVGRFWLSDSRDVFTLVAFLAIGLTTSHFSDRARKEALHARLSEKELREMIEAIPAMAFTTLPDGSNTFANRRWTEYTGLSLKDTVGSGWQIAVHPDDLERHLEKWRASVATGELFEGEGRFRRAADGQYRWFLVRGVPLREDAHGKILKWCGTATDVEDRKRGEEALRRSEADLLDAQRISQTGSWKLDASSGTVTVSPEAFRIFGVKPDEDTSTAEFWLSRNHPEDQKRIRELFERSTIQKTDYDADYRIVLPDGAIKHLHAVGHPVLNEAGDLAEFVGTVMDITERKKAEEQLQQSEREARQLLDLSPMHISEIGPDGIPLYNNQAALEYHGITLEEWKSTSRSWLTRSDLSIWVHPQDAERWLSEYPSKLLDGSPFEIEVRLKRRDGQYRWFHFRINPMRDEQGRITRWYAAGTDIEDRKVAEQRLQDENVALREEIDKASMFEEIVGTSAPLKTVLSSIVKVAPTDSTVLITGETGTGKELIARAIHKHSQRSGQAFISVNCASIPSSLIASELFGHEKGAFTGAVQRRQGRFELAHSGTIFLDEVGELPAETQIALLRVLQERQFERVGGNQLLSTDVRVITATNRDLTAAIAAGTFRADLFYRLNVFPIDVPPLRRRKEDIPMLVEYFVERYAEKMGKQIRKIDKNTLELCQLYPWPGNIRELQNIVERSVILCSGDTFWIEKAWLASEQPLRQELLGPLLDTLQNQEKGMIEAALAESKGKVAGPEGAAAKLGIHRSTLDSKIKQLKIKKYKFLSEA